MKHVNFGYIINEYVELVKYRQSVGFTLSIEREGLDAAIKATNQRLDWESKS